MGVVAVKHDPASAAVVRRMLADELTAQSVSPDRIDDVVLVASELVGNAVTHTNEVEHDLDIGWNVDGSSVTVWVADTSDVVPQRRTADSLDTNGRGLAIIAAIAADWGVEKLSRGKRVWARVSVAA